MFQALSLIGSILALAGTALSYSYPGPCSGTCTNTHDPFIVRRSDGKYYRFSTNGRIATHTATSLQGPWTYQGSALPGGSTIPGNHDLWAPDVIQIGNTYYLYYAVSTFGTQDSTIGVATSTSLDSGSWKDMGSTGVASKKGMPYNAIDPNLINVNGQWVMTFGSFWQDLFQVPMQNPPTRAVAAAPNQVAFEPATTALEGASMFKYGNFYYLFFSQGSCCGYDQNRPAKGREYKIQVCRSASATGGFVDRNNKDCRNGGGTTVLESHDWVYGPGGQGVINDPSQGPVLYYHYVDTRIGYSDGQKRFGWNKIDFSSGWPVV